MDERTVQIGNRAAVITLVVAYFYQFVVAVGKVIAARDVSAATFEIVFLAGLPWVFLFLARSNETTFLPRVGSDDPDALMSSEAVAQRNRSYLKENAALALGLTALSAVALWFFDDPDAPELLIGGEGLLQQPALFATALAVEFIIAFVIFYVLGRWWGELQIKRYVRTLKEMES